MFAEPEAIGPELLEAFAIADTDSAPVVALENYNRPGKGKFGESVFSTEDALEYLRQETAAPRATSLEV